MRHVQVHTVKTSICVDPQYKVTSVRRRFPNYHAGSAEYAEYAGFAGALFNGNRIATEWIRNGYRMDTEWELNESGELTHLPKLNSPTINPLTVILSVSYKSTL
jgi:hypothetical protein